MGNNIVQCAREPDPAGRPCRRRRRAHSWTLYAPQPLLPLFARTFDASTFDVGLTVTAPAVAVALAAPSVGRIADTIGLRRVIVGSAFRWRSTTALAAMSRTLGQFMFWRFVQGIITPGMFACTVAYIHEVWPPAQAGRATAVYMIGTIVGGFIGRALARDSSPPTRTGTSAFAALATCCIWRIAIVLWRAGCRLNPRGMLAPFAAPQGARGFSRASDADCCSNVQLRATYASGFASCSRTSRRSPT